MDFKLLILIFLICGCYGHCSSPLNHIVEKVNSANALWKAEHILHPDSVSSIYETMTGSVSMYDEDNNNSDELPDMDENGNTHEDIVGHDGCKKPEVEFDARKVWPNCPSIGKIWDQGDCGSDWVIAPVSVMTDRMCIATNGTFQGTLSPQTPLACCKSCGFGCKKGYSTEVYKYFEREGIVTGGDYASHEGCQPYTIGPCNHFRKGYELPTCKKYRSIAPYCTQRCYNRIYDKRFDADIIKTNGTFKGQCPGCVLGQLRKFGPVSATLMVFEDFLVYKSGIYHHIAGDRIGLQTIRIIGWGEENDVKYWIAANSWNKNWGENGFFRIKRGEDECGIEGAFRGGYPVVK